MNASLASVIRPDEKLLVCEPVPLATAESVKVVAFWIEAMMVPGVMFVPETTWPTCSEAVLAVVTSVVPFVVIACVKLPPMVLLPATLRKAPK